MDSLIFKIAVVVFFVVIWAAIMSDFWMKYESHKAWREAVNRENEEKNKAEEWKRRERNGIK